MTRRSARVVLAAIVLLAAFLRIYFFVGLVSGDPQDDGIYYNNAFRLYSEGHGEIRHFRGRPADWIPNPIDQFHVRPMVTYPIAASFAMFGPGEASAALWALVCSLVTVVLVFRLGVAVHDRTVGLVAALLCAIYPLEVVNATRVLSDVQLGMFSALGVFLLVEADRRRSVAWYGLAGAAAGGAYLANARGLLVLLVLLGAALLQWLASNPRGRWQGPVMVVAGFGVVFAAEAAVYYTLAGDPLLSYHIQAGASSYKYLHEPVRHIDLPWVRVSFTNGEPLDLLRAVLGLSHRPNQFGFFFVLFFAAALFGLSNGRNRVLVAVALGLCLYLEFGPVRLTVDQASGKLNYMMVFKQDRFLLVVTAPLVVLSAYLVRSAARKSWLVALTLVSVLAVSSLDAIQSTHAFYRAGWDDIRAVAPHVRSQPDVRFFADLWAVEYLTVLTRHRAANLRVLGASTKVEELEGACLILGGSRGVELLAEFVESTVPDFAREVLTTGRTPAGWMLKQQVAGPFSPQRHHDLRLFCVPDRPPHDRR